LIRATYIERISLPNGIKDLDKGGRNMETIKNLWFDGHRIFMRSSEGRILSRPLEAYPELEEATTEQRNNFTIEDEGRAIRWEELDADMHIFFMKHLSQMIRTK
jgi:hypothetical protein